MLLPTRYEIDLRLLPPRTEEAEGVGELRVSGRVHLVNDGDRALDRAPFLLHPDLRVEAFSSGRGAPLDYLVEVRPVSDAPRVRAVHAEVRLPAPLDPGETAVVAFDYSGRVSGYTGRWPYIRDRVGCRTLLRPDALWYPLPVRRFEEERALLTHRFSYRVAVRAPADLVVVCGGERTDGAVERGVRTTVFESRLPAWRIDVAAAPYRTLPGGEAGGAALVVHAYPEHARAGAVVLEAMTRTGRLFASRFLPLPSPRRLDLAEIPEGWGGQASATLVLQPSDAFEFDSRRPYADLLVERLYRVAHEVAHLWNADSGEAWPSRFLDEGFAHHGEVLVLREEAGAPAALRRLGELRELFLRGGEQARTTPLARAGRSAARNEVSRGKGPWLLAVLEALLGEEVYARIVREFLSRHAPWTDRLATPADFAEIAAEVAGRDLDRFFAEWLFGAGSSGLMQSHGDPAAIADRYV